MTIKLTPVFAIEILKILVKLLNLLIEHLSIKEGVING